MNVQQDDKYRKYLFNHIKGVKKAYDWINENIFDYALDMPDIYLHDNSKFTPEEYDAYADYFYGEQTGEVKEAFDYAWNRHQKVNPHHWQYWVLINDEDGIKALDMPMEYIIEMICDWWAFSWVKDDLEEIFSWYKKNKKKMMLSDNTRFMVEDILDKMKEKLNNE